MVWGVAGGPARTAGAVSVGDEVVCVVPHSEGTMAVRAVARVTVWVVVVHVVVRGLEPCVALLDRVVDL